jgi:hypothetical protein
MQMMMMRQKRTWMTMTEDLIQQKGNALHKYAKMMIGAQCTKVKCKGKATSMLN